MAEALLLAAAEEARLRSLAKIRSNECRRKTQNCGTMWKALDPSYFITFVEETKDFYYIGVMDFKRYWITNTSRKSFLADLKESNDGLEFDDESELLQRGLDMVANPEQLQKVNVTQEEKGNFITVSMSKMYEITLKLELVLMEASTDHFFEAVIQPLLKTVCDLRSSQHELRELLIKKDKEIEEYKIEGKAPRRLITTVYDDAAHMMKHTTYEEFFSAPKVPELLEATAFSSSTRRKRPASPEIEKKDVEIKKSSQDNVVDEIVPPNTEETEIKVPGLSEVKSRKQRKRLNY